jgi:hypothetical protein
MLWDGAALLLLVVLCIIAAMLLAAQVLSPRLGEPCSGAFHLSGAPLCVLGGASEGPRIKALAVGDSFTRPLMLDPSIRGRIFSGKTVRGLAKDDDAEAAKIVAAVRKFRPRCVLTWAGTVDLNFVFFYKMRVGTVDTQEFAQETARAYLKFLQKILAELPPNGVITSILPTYSVVEDKYVEKSLRAYKVLGVRDEFTSQMREKSSRAVRNHLVDLFNAAVAEGLAGELRVRLVDLNPLITDDGLVRPQFRHPRNPMQIHLMWEPLYPLLRELIRSPCSYDPNAQESEAAYKLRLQARYDKN